MKRIFVLMLLAASLSFAQSTPINGSRSLNFPNDQTIGTVQYHLATLNGSPSSTVVVSAPTDALSSVVGICDTFCGTSGIAWIANYGLQKCTFDNATTANDTVTIGTGGACHDTGSRTAAGVAIVQSTNASAGTYQVVWTGASTSSTGGGPGSPGVGVPTGGTVGQALVKNSTTNYDTIWQTISGSFVWPGAIPSGTTIPYAQVTGQPTIPNLAAPGAIGGTTPAAATFTTVAAGTIIPSGLTPSTAPVCVNGPGGSLINTGCAGGASGAWGAITGTLSAQTDLQTALNAKEPANANIQAHVTNVTTNPHAVTKAQVGLGSVDNTSDALKPPSTAQAIVNAAVATKEPAAGNPSTNGYVWSSSAAGARSWIPGGSVTASAMQTALSGQAGCATAGNVWSPVTNTCVSLNSGFVQISCNGTSADQTAIVAADSATANIALVSGSCLLSSNVTLNGTYWFFGGKLAPATSVIVTMNVQPQASPIQVFTGLGTLKLNNSAQVFPEWWGAMGNSGSYTDSVPFNATVAALASGTIVLTKPNYYTASPFVVNKSYINVHSPNGPRGTWINSNSPTATIFSVGGTAATCAAGSSNFNHLDGFAVARTVPPSGASKGFDLTDSCWLEAHDIEAWDSIDNFYFSGTANAFIWNSSAVVGTLSNTLTVNGFHLDSSLTQNASVRLGPHAVVGNLSATSHVTGLYAYGTAPNDLFLNDFETASVDYGVKIDGSATAGTAGALNHDIHIVNNVHDDCKITCVLLTGLNTDAVFGANVTINDLWAGVYRNGGTGIALINSRGVQVSNAQFLNWPLVGGNTTTGISFFGSSGNRISGVQMSDFTSPLTLSASNDNIIRATTFNSNSAGLTAGTIATFVSSSSNKIELNGDMEYATTGISFDASSGSNNFDISALNLTNITTPVTNSGTANFAVASAPFTFTIGMTAIAANTCTTAATVTVKGLTTAMTIFLTATSDTSAVTGWGASGGLVIAGFPSVTGTYSYKVCNQTTASITPGASVTFNGAAR